MRRRREIPRIVFVALLGVLAGLMLVLLFRQYEGLAHEATAKAKPLYLRWEAWVFFSIVVGFYVSYLKQHARLASQHAVDEKIRTHRLIECLPQAIVVVDEAQQVLAANAAAGKLLGKDPAECLEKPLAGLLGASSPLPAGQSRVGLGTAVVHPVSPEKGQAGGAVVVLMKEEAARTVPCGIGACLEEALGELASSLQSRRLTVARSGDWSLKVLGHPAWLRAAVRELLRNACAHAPEGSAVSVSVEQAGGQVRLRILNQGAAIREGMEGSGLGVARAALGAMGGSLRLEGVEGRGTRATVEVVAPK